jgi:hypothetical protein
MGGSNGTYAHHGSHAPAGGRRSRASAVPRLRAQRVEVSVVPRRLPPAARVHPLLTLFVSESESSIAKATPLRALFTLLDEAGSAEVHRRTHVHTSWLLLEKEQPLVALRLEISEPVDARGVVDVVMDATDYQRVWESIRDARWVGITSKRRLHPHADGSALPVDEAFAACIPLLADPPPATAAMARL